MLDDDRPWSGMDLIGKAKSYAGRYRDSRDNLLDRLRNSGLSVRRVPDPLNRNAICYHIGRPGAPRQAEQNVNVQTGRRKMKVTRDRHMGLDVYRVEQAPIATRALRDHPDWIDDRWYYREADRNWERLDGDGMTIAKGREIIGVYAYIPMLDGSDYEEIIIEEDVPDMAERWGARPLLARVAWAKKDIEDRLADR